MPEEESKKKPFAFAIAQVVTLAGALTAVYQCSEARAKVSGLEAQVEHEKAETEKLKKQIESAPAERTIQVAKELAKYPDAADRALVLRAIAKLDPDPAVRSWAESELARLRPELEQQKKETSETLVATTELRPSPMSTTTPPPSSSGAGPIAMAPMTKFALKDTRTLTFDATLKRAARLDAILDTKPAAVRKCAAGSAKGALSETDSATCKGSLDGSGVPTGADEVHPASGNGMIYWRVKSPAGLVHCQCKEG